MFAYYIGMNVLWIDTQMPREQYPKTSCIQGCATAKHMTGCDTALTGNPRCQVRHHIDWVGRDHDDRVGCVVDNVRDHRMEHTRIALKKLHSSFTRLLIHAC